MPAHDFLPGTSGRPRTEVWLVFDVPVLMCRYAIRRVFDQYRAERALVFVHQLDRAEMSSNLQGSCVRATRVQRQVGHRVRCFSAHWSIGPKSVGPRVGNGSKWRMRHLVDQIGSGPSDNHIDDLLEPVRIGVEEARYADRPDSI